MEEVRAKKVNSRPTNPGEYLFLFDDDDLVEGIAFSCPCGCGDVTSLFFGEPGQSIFPRWKWNKSKLKPSLDPLIEKEKGCRWSGTLQEGIFRGKT